MNHTLKLSIKISRIGKIIIGSVALKLIVLVAILTLDGTLPSFAFMGSYDNDDYRYVEGAKIYAEKADSLIDYDAFTNAYASLGDWVGYQMKTDLALSAPGWYIICCLVMYIFRFDWSIRLFNILISSLAVYYLYRIMVYVNGEKAALITAKCMAFLPYPVIFSCFCYKEYMAMLIFAYMCCFSIRKKRNEDMKISAYIGLILCIIILLSMKRGVSILFFAILIIYYFWESIKRHINARMLALVVAGALAAVYMIYRFWDVIYFMANAYIFSDTSGATLGGGRFVHIRSIWDLWKLPLTYMFAIVNPIGLGSIQSWSSVVAILNVVMIPISICSFMGLFAIRKADDKILLYGVLVLYLLTIITSVLIYRQIFWLFPVPIMIYSVFRTSGQITFV